MFILTHHVILPYAYAVHHWLSAPGCYVVWNNADQEIYYEFCVRSMILIYVRSMIYDTFCATATARV